MEQSVPLTPGHRARHVVVVVVAIGIAATLVAMTAALVPHSFSLQFYSTSGGPPGWGTLTPPRGSVVSGSWSTADGANFSFQIQSNDGGIVLHTGGASGSFRFTAGDPPYFFSAIYFSATGEPVNVTGTYSSPLI